jgi:organic hydroperoxide reductase OsmC/OhrA
MSSDAPTAGLEQPSVHRARVAWDGGERDDLRAHTIRMADQAVAASSAEALGGDPAKADPEELFVASLSSCHMLWFLGLARAERIRVTSYEDEAEGEMDGHCFTRVVLRPRVSAETEVDEETLDSLHHRAHQRCFIANSVSCPVEIKARR